MLLVLAAMLNSSSSYSLLEPIQISTATYGILPSLARSFVRSIDRSIVSVSWLTPRDTGRAHHSTDGCERQWLCRDRQPADTLLGEPYHVWFSMAAPHTMNQCRRHADSPDESLLLARSQYGRSPLLRACAYGHTDIAKYLIALKADVNGRCQVW